MFSETKQNKRIRVLKDEEYQQTYGLPMFSREEQEWFFELTQQELSVLDTAATTETKIDAILQLGYFKAKQSFFAWTFNSVQSDFDYIRHRYFDSVITTKSTIGRKAKYNNQQWVLSLFGYALFSKEKHSERLSEKINNPARTYYASLAEHYTAQGLNRTKQLQSCFWLLCFIHYRYQRMCDNLVTMFIYIFNQYDKAIKESTQALLLAEALSEAAQKAVVAKLMRFYIDKDIDRTQPFSSIIEKAYSIIDPELIEQVATRYENHKFNEKFTWQSISELLPNWLNEKEAVLKKLSNPRLDQSVDQFIEEKAKPLDKKIIAINEAIQNGQNPDVKIKTAKNGSIIWTLPYTKKGIELNNPFYEKIPTVSISQVLHFVNQHTRFIQQFTHIKPHKAKSQLDELCIFANLIGKGTNLGSAKMAELCDLPQNELTASDQHFIRLATLRNDNDVISNAIAALPIFRNWNFAADLLHASLDGQKFITEFDTLLSRYSPKYFGLMKGVVAYTLLANHITLNVKIIGANEHESCHLFDLIYNNTSNVQPDIFSTDTEGSNQLNFLLLNLINKVFAPRYRSLSTKTESIISFSDPKKFEDLLIKPSSQLHVNRLLKQENNIQHILASLLIGETNQSNIISKLSCNAFSNQTKLP